MTRERADEIVRYIKNELDNNENAEIYLDVDDYKIIVEALEQEPCEDCVSRANLINQLEILDKRYGSDFYWEVRKIVDNLSPVTPTHCIATVKFSKEDIQKLVNEKMKDIVVEREKIDKAIRIAEDSISACFKLGLNERAFGMREILKIFEENIEE